VAFVRKRDKRVLAHKKKLEERAAEVKKLAEEKKRKHIQERLRDIENYKEAEWTTGGDFENNLTALENKIVEEFQDQDIYSEEEDEEELNFYCVACNKSFRTNKALVNHEKSKKHKESALILLEQLTLEDEEMKNVQINTDIDDVNIDSKLNGVETELFETEDSVILSSDAESTNRTTKLSKKQKKKRKQQKAAIESELNSCEIENGVDQISETGDELTVNNDQISELNEEVSKNAVSNLSVSDSALIIEDCPEESPVDENNDKSDEKTHKKQNKSSNQGIAEKCKVCGDKFPSRSKLFQHVKESGHAVVKDSNVQQSEENHLKKKKGKNKKK